MKKIVVTKRNDDFHACLAGHSEIWDCGKTVSEAVGKLLLTHSDTFDLVILHPDSTRMLLDDEILGTG